MKRHEITLSNEETLKFDNLGFTISKLGNKVSIKTKYKNVFGLGQRYLSVNHKGLTYENKVEEKFCNQKDKTYFPLPFFHLDNELGFYLETNEIFTIKFKDSIEIIFDKPIDSLDLTIYKGRNKDIIAGFIEDTGGSNLAPDWIYGLWVSAHRLNSTKSIKNALEEYQENDIPYSVVVLEQWSDEATFYMFNNSTTINDTDKVNLKTLEFNEPIANPKQLFDYIKAQNAHTLLWQAPIIKELEEDEVFNQRHANDITYALENNLLVKESNKAYRIPKGNWFPHSLLPDFSNPKTNDWYFGKRKYLLDLGIDGFKTDGGEFIHSGQVNTFDGLSGSEKINTYITDYLKAYKNFVGDNRVLFSRAGYIGQQSTSLQWVGDQESTWSELQAVYRALLSLSLSGQSNIGFDIGGFSGELPEPDLYRRNVQLAAFVPIMQIHSEPLYGQFEKIRKNDGQINDRSPWNVANYFNDDKLVLDTKEFFQMRSKLNLYYKSWSIKSSLENSTMMRHMVVDFKNLKDIDSQHMFCDFLVAPILSENTKQKVVNLPQGGWYDYYTKKQIDGDQAITVDVDNNSIPVFVLEGTCIPTVTSEGLTLELYGESGCYTLYQSTESQIEICWKDGVLLDSDKNIYGYKTFEVINYK